jgi:hypothetical protein
VVLLCQTVLLRQLFESLNFFDISVIFPKATPLTQNARDHAVPVEIYDREKAKITVKE